MGAVDVCGDEAVALHEEREPMMIVEVIEIQ